MWAVLAATTLDPTSRLHRELGDLIDSAAEIEGLEQVPVLYLRSEKLGHFTVLRTGDFARIADGPRRERAGLVSAHEKPNNRAD